MVYVLNIGDHLRGITGYPIFNGNAEIDKALGQIYPSSIFSLFNVDSALHRQGIGRQLMNAAIDRCRKAKPDLDKITVNAASGAVIVYQRLGFVSTSPELKTNGIRYVPMALIIK